MEFDTEDQVLLHIVIQGNIIATNTISAEMKNLEVYIHDLREVTIKRVEDSDLWTKKIPCTSRIATPCFGLNTNSVVTCTLPGELGGWDGTTTVTVWDFSGNN